MTQLNRLQQTFLHLPHSIEKRLLAYTHDKVALLANHLYYVITVAGLGAGSLMIRLQRFL